MSIERKDRADGTDPSKLNYGVETDLKLKHSHDSEKKNLKTKKNRVSKKSIHPKHTKPNDTKKQTENQTKIAERKTSQLKKNAKQTLKTASHSNSIDMDKQSREEQTIFKAKALREKNLTQYKKFLKEKEKLNRKENSVSKNNPNTKSIKTNNSNVTLKSQFKDSVNPIPPNKEQKKFENTAKLRRNKKTSKVSAQKYKSGSQNYLQSIPDDAHDRKKENVVSDNEEVIHKSRNSAIVNEYDALRRDYIQARHIENKDFYGQGNFGEVNLALLETLGGHEHEIAYKISKNKNRVAQKSIEKENELLRKLDSPYILKIHPSQTTSEKNKQVDFVIKSKAMIMDEDASTLRPVTAEDNENDAYEFIEEAEVNPPGLAMERKTKNFEQVVSMQNPIEKEVIFHDILQGLVYLKDNGIAHCDIKPENILIDSGGHAVIADFGTATDSPQNLQVRGTPLYMSPDAYGNLILNVPLRLEKLSPEGESMRAQGYNTFELDSWSMGVSIVRSYCHDMPNEGRDAIGECCVLKGEEIYARATNNPNTAIEFKRKFERAWDELIQRIPIKPHRELAAGLLQKHWTVTQALDHLFNNGLSFKKKQHNRLNNKSKNTSDIEHKKNLNHLKRFASKTDLPANETVQDIKQKELDRDLKTTNDKFKEIKHSEILDKQVDGKKQKIFEKILHNQKEHQQDSPTKHETSQKESRIQSNERIKTAQLNTPNALPDKKMHEAPKNITTKGTNSSSPISSAPSTASNIEVNAILNEVKTFLYQIEICNHSHSLTRLEDLKKSYNAILKAKNTNRKIDIDTYHALLLLKKKTESHFESLMNKELQETNELIQWLANDSNTDIYNIRKMQKTYNIIINTKNQRGEMNFETQNALTLLKTSANRFLSSILEKERHETMFLLNRISKQPKSHHFKLNKLRKTFEALKKENMNDAQRITQYKQLMTLKNNVLVLSVNHASDKTSYNKRGYSGSTGPLKPIKIAEEYSKLFSNEFTGLIDNSSDKKRTIEQALDYLNIIYKQWRNHRASHDNAFDKLEKTNSAKSASLINTFFEKEGNKLILRPNFIDQKVFSRCFSQQLNSDNATNAIAFANKLNKIIASMLCQTPPGVLKLPNQSSLFNSSRSRAFVSPGTYIDYNIWPTLYLYSGGPVISKGVSQPTNKKKNKKD